MFDAPPSCEVESTSPKNRKRRAPDDDAPKYVRRIKGAYQARVWLGEAGVVNLGLFSVLVHGSHELAEWSAARAAREFVKRYNGKNLHEVVEELKRLRYVPDCVLPRHVVRTTSGTYTARCYFGKPPHAMLVQLPTEHATAPEAAAAFAEYTDRELLAGRLEATAPQIEIVVRQFEHGYGVATAAKAAGVSASTAARVRRAAGGDARFGRARWRRFGKVTAGEEGPSAGQCDAARTG